MPEAPLFRHEKLTAIPDGEDPTPKALNTIFKELRENASANHSNQGGGAHGHLALVLTAPEYLAIAGEAFDPPVHPGPVPVHEAGATAFQIAEVNRAFAADKDEFDRYIRVKQFLKNQLLTAIPNRYTELLEDINNGYTNVEIITIIQHLRTNYAAISIDELNQNKKDMIREWQPDQSGVEAVWSQIRRGVQFAAIEDPISDMACLGFAIDVIRKSGLFADKIDDFLERPKAEQTYANFVLAINKADKLRRAKLTSGAAGYHSALMAHTAAPAKTQKAPVPVPATVSSTSSAGKYCWSHGYNSNPTGHCSATCHAPYPGHRTDATLDDMLGGNNTIRRKPNDPAVWKPPANRNRNRNKANAATAAATAPSEA